MHRRIIFTFIFIGICSTAKVQIPVEIFAGHKRTTLDMMFFKYFKNSQAENTRWLFFNRNRASIDYRMTKTSYLPQFGVTEAVSFNHQKLKGFAPVLVVQVFNFGVYPKAGIQYVHIQNNMVIFSWLVLETLENPDMDYFLLFRFTPEISDKIKLFTQFESINTFPTDHSENYSFTQRIRMGLQFTSFQFGGGADFNQTGNSSFTRMYNAGIFIRHEF